MAIELEPKPWDILGKIRKINRERILAAYRDLDRNGIHEADWVSIAEADAALRFPGRPDPSLKMMGEGAVQKALSELEQQGVLTSRLEIVAFTLRTVEKRLYSQPQEPSVLPTNN